MTEEQVEHMVGRFLYWGLPHNFSPNGGISYTPPDRRGAEIRHHSHVIGINLFSAAQAEQMIRYMLENLPVAHPQRSQATKSTINDHVLTSDNARHIVITVMDMPGPGGASHHYAVEVPGVPSLDIWFQKGPVGEVGANGITEEALLAILLDRLRAFQRGPYACRENECALTRMEEALHWLQQRTIARMRRGVEGKSAV